MQQNGLKCSSSLFIKKASPQGTNKHLSVTSRSQEIQEYMKKAKTYCLVCSVHWPMNVLWEVTRWLSLRNIKTCMKLLKDSRDLCSWFQNIYIKYQNKSFSQSNGETIHNHQFYSWKWNDSNSINHIRKKKQRFSWGPYLLQNAQRKRLANH